MKRDHFKMKFSFVCLCWLLHSVSFAVAAPPSELPRLALSDFKYEGAFRVPSSSFGDSNMNYSEGLLEYNADRNSIYIVGHSHHQAIAEFALPSLVKSTTVSALKMAAAPLQNFSTVLDRVSGGNPQSINRIGGMEYVVGPNGPELLINGYEYYDGPRRNKGVRNLYLDQYANIRIARRSCAAIRTCSTVSSSPAVSKVPRSPERSFHRQTGLTGLLRNQDKGS